MQTVMSTLWRNWIFFSTCIVVLLIWAPPASSNTIRFASIDYCPFTCDPVIENGKEGIMTDVVRAAFEEQGYAIEIELMPYARAVQLVRQGKYDGIMVVGKYYAPDLVYTEKPTLTQRMMFMVKPTHKWRYDGYSSLSNVIVAVIRGFDYADDEINSYVRDNGDSHKLVMLHGNNTTERGLKMLHSGRVDTYIEGQLTALYHIDKYGLSEEFTVAGFSARPFEDFTAFSPQSPHAHKYADILTKKIHQLKQSGELKNMLNLYGISVEP